MNTKNRDLKKIAEKRTLKSKKDMDGFYKKHILNSDDIIVIVVKSHLYIESCLNNLLSTVLPYPDKILKKSFSNKVDIFEAMNLGFPADHKLMVSKFRQINSIRNKLAHNLNKRINKNDLKGLIKDMPMKDNASINQKLKYGLSNFIGYFHCHLALNEFLPFYASYARNKKIFKKDIGLDDKRLLLGYRMNDVSEILKHSRMK